MGFLLLINQCSSRTGIKLHVGPCPSQNNSLHAPAALSEGHQTPLHPALLVPGTASSPLPHQLHTAQHALGTIPGQLLPQRSPFQGREAASPASRQPFQGKDSRSSDIFPRAGSSCNPTAPWRLNQPWICTGKSTLEDQIQLKLLLQPQEGGCILALVALLISSRFKSSLRQEPCIPAGNTNDMGLECTFT